MLLLTTVVSILSVKSGLTVWYVRHPVWFLLTLLSEIGLVLAYSSLRETLTFQRGLILMGFYTWMNGLTLSVVLAAYPVRTLFLSFFLSTGIFLAASLYGLTTKKSLTTWKPWLFIGLVSLLISIVVNILLHSALISYVISSMAVVLFSGLAIYDAKKIQDMSQGNPSMLDALDCALDVYLDFINLFLHVLRIFGIDIARKD